MPLCWILSRDHHDYCQDPQHQNVLELMIPPTKRLGSVVVTRPASHGEVPGSNPSLVVLFSLTGYEPCQCLTARNRDLDD